MRISSTDMKVETLLTHHSEPLIQKWRQMKSHRANGKDDTVRNDLDSERAWEYIE